MRTPAFVPCSFTLLLALACSESPTQRAIREASNRPPDAGVVLPMPATATLLASGQNIPRNLIADEGHLYWLNEGLKAEGKAGIFRVGKAGGNVETLWEGKGVEAIAVVSGSLYAIVPLDEKVLRIPKAGGKAEVVIADHPGLSAIAADDSSVYWTSEEGIIRAPHSGGTPKALVTGLTPPMGLSLDRGNLYWYSVIDGKVMRASASGGTPRKWFEPELTLHDYFAHDGQLFWALGSQGKVEIRRTAASGGAPLTVTSGQSIPVELTADGSNVYWTTGDAVMKAPKEGGSATAIVQGTDRSISVVVDESSVYWTDRGGRIQKVAKN
jgi:hypothetical protein